MSTSGVREPPITMLDMVLLVESEVARLEAWQSVQGSQFGKARELAVYRALVKALDRMLVFEREIARLVGGPKPRGVEPAGAQPTTH